MATLKKRLFAALLAFAALGPAQAWADSTLIIRPTGTAKQRNIDKVGQSLVAKAKAMPDVSVGTFEVGPDCIADLECLASAGRDSGARVVVGVHVSRTGSDFVVLFVAVDSASGLELAHHEIQNVRRKVLADMAGAALDEFLTTLPRTPSVPVEPAAEPASEPAEPATEPAESPTDPEAVLAPSITPEPDATGGEENLVEPAFADTESSDDETAGAYTVELGLVTGLVVPQISSELGTTAGIEFDVGVPVWKALSVVGAVGYSQPVVDSALSDPRISGGMYETETTQRELMLTLGATWRFLEPASRLNAYAGVGPRVWLLETKTNGSSAGMAFGENQETSTRYGAAGWAGAEYLLGPGALAGELDVGGSDLPHLVTGDVATTAIALQLGYRIRL